MPAKLYPDPTLSKDTIGVTENNPWKLVKGDKAKLVCNDFSQFARVRVDAAVEDKDADHVLSSTWTGVSGTQGELQKISAWTYTASLLRASVKLRLGFFAAIVAIGTAYLNAALTKEGTFQYHLGAGRWILFALTAAATLVAWAKDIWGS